MTIITGSKQYTTNSTNVFSSAVTQPYRFGGRVGLFGHYLRSLKIILLLACIKLDAAVTTGGRFKVVDSILKGICELASSIEAVERLYVKKGQRLLFCGPDLMALGPKCAELQLAFDALTGKAKNVFWKALTVLFYSLQTKRTRPRVGSLAFKKTCRF